MPFDLAGLLSRNPELAEYNPELVAEVAKESPPKPTPAVRPVSRWRSERHFQSQVFVHIDDRATRDPVWGLIYHVPNENSHHESGVKGGVLDIHWPIARRGYVGLWLELKIAGGHVSPKQIFWQQALRDEGHFVEVVWEDLDRVIETLEWYIGGEDAG